MRKKTLSQQLPVIAALGGILVALLRFWYYKNGIDEKGLLLQNHPAHYLIWIVTAGILALCLLGSFPLKHGNKFRSNFPADPISALGCFTVFAACTCKKSALFVAVQSVMPASSSAATRRLTANMRFC